MQANLRDPVVVAGDLVELVQHIRNVAVVPIVAQHAVHIDHISDVAVQRQLQLRGADIGQLPVDRFQQVVLFRVHHAQPAPPGEVAALVVNGQAAQQNGHDREKKHGEHPPHQRMPESGRAPSHSMPPYPFTLPSVSPVTK